MQCSSSTRNLNIPRCFPFIGLFPSEVCRAGFTIGRDIRSTWFFHPRELLQPSYCRPFRRRGFGNRCGTGDKPRPGKKGTWSNRTRKRPVCPRCLGRFLFLRPECIPLFQQRWQQMDSLHASCHREDQSNFGIRHHGPWDRHDLMRPTRAGVSFEFHCNWIGVSANCWSDSGDLQTGSNQTTKFQQVIPTVAAFGQNWRCSWSHEMHFCLTHLWFWGCTRKSRGRKSHQSCFVEWSFQPPLRDQVFRNRQCSKSCGSTRALLCRWICLLRIPQQKCIGWVHDPRFPFLPVRQTRVGCARSTIFFMDLKILQLKRTIHWDSDRFWNRRMKTYILHIT